MRNLTKIIFAFAAVLAAGAAYAQTGITQSDFIEDKAPLDLRTTHDNVTIAFDMPVDDRIVTTDQAVVITPRFVSSGRVLKTLPAIVIQGRNYSIIAGEKRKFDKAAVIPVDVDDIYRTIIYKRGETDGVHYQIRIPYMQEFKGAVLELNQKTYSLCNLGAGRKDKSTGKRPGGTVWIAEKNIVLANGVTDYSDMHNGGPVAYYFPNRVNRRYENDFSNHSVFAIGSRTIDMDTFVRYGYTDFKKELERLLADRDVTIEKVRVSTSASPEGPLDKNKKLAEVRADVISDYLVRNLDLPAGMIEKHWVDENWDAFMQDLRVSSLSDKDGIREIVASTSDLDLRERQLRALDNWDEIFDIFQNLRNCHIIVDYAMDEHHPDRIFIGDRDMAVVEIDGTPVLSLDRTSEYYNADQASVAGISNMMVALTELGRYEEAQTYADRIPNRDLLPVIANNKGVLYMLSGKPDMARNMFGMAKNVPMSDHNMKLIPSSGGQSAPVQEEAPTEIYYTQPVVSYVGSVREEAAQPVDAKAEKAAAKAAAKEAARAEKQAIADQVAANKEAARIAKEEAAGLVAAEKAAVKAARQEATGQAAAEKEAAMTARKEAADRAAAEKAAAKAAAREAAVEAKAEKAAARAAAKEAVKEE